MTNQVFRRLNTTPQMMSVLGDTELLQAMLDFEGGLAHAGSRCDLFEPSVADTIKRFCQISHYCTRLCRNCLILIPFWTNLACGVQATPRDGLVALDYRHIIARTKKRLLVKSF